MIADSANRARLRALLPFLAGADEAFVERFFQRATLLKLAKERYISHEGELCGGLALLLSGSARIFKLGENGREITLYRIGRGESCILTASCIVSGRPFPASARTETEVEAVLVPTGEVNGWMAEFPAWRDYVFGLLADRLGDIISVVEEVVFRRMDRRIASYLLRGTDEQADATLHATHQEIAADLGSSREVVSRILKELETRGRIETQRGAIRVLDRAALHRFVNEA